MSGKRKTPRAQEPRGVVAPSPPSSAKAANLDDRPDGRQRQTGQPVQSGRCRSRDSGERAHTPLSRRDKRLLAAVAAVIAVAAAVAAVVVSRDALGLVVGAGCVVVDVPSTMGGARLRNCGSAAHGFCRTQGPLDPRVAAACRKQGFAADVAAGR